MLFVSWITTWSTSVTDVLVQKLHFRYNGGNIVTEPSSRFNHTRVGALGSYRGSPFVTGSNNTADGLKTEILNKQFLEWVQEADYPFSDSDR